MCGWKGELCEIADHKNDNLIIIVCASFFVISILVLIGFYGQRKYRFESALKTVGDMKVNWSDVIQPQPYSISSINIERGDNTNNTTCLYTALFKGSIVIVEILGECLVNFYDRNTQVALTTMRELTHVNLCQFVGICSDSPNVCLLLSNAERGTLHHVLMDEIISLGFDFKLSLISDIAEGMNFLHQSAIDFHGTLSSFKCVIDSKWTCKIYGFGLQMVRSSIKKTSATHMLWMAPEALHETQDTISKNSVGLKERDVYSFGIIVQEIVLQCPPYGLNDTSLDTSQIVQNVRQGCSPVFRPVVPIDSAPQLWIELMQKCWQEAPSDRPSFAHILSLVRAMNQGNDINLIDKMINLLEHHTTNLEEMVVCRLHDIEVEKSKVEELLNELLPRSVAHQLKRGIVVDPEVFDCVTIFFSDIVGFTKISSAAEPIQIIQMLNEMYTLFDDTTQAFDVYKVATIGDAYIVASGVPIRNGDKHAAEICKLALALRDSVHQVTIPHMPRARLQMRMGIHSGSCVGAVTGLKMPRFLLFGNTVDIAAKMESGGESMKIHVSETTKQLIDGDKDLVVTRRGEMMMKGKGYIDTYWLHI